LNVFPLPIPALRQRPDDIVPLARRFLAERGGRPGLHLAPAAEAALRAYSWPGNVRELENVMQRATILATGDIIEPGLLHLPADRLRRSDRLEGAAFVSPPSENPNGSSLLQVADGMKPSQLGDVERAHILETLVAVGGSRKLASERLGMPERTLRYKLKQYRDAGFFNE
jgi:two-component system response regulator FlrC